MLDALHLFVSYDGTDLVYIALPGPLAVGDPNSPADRATWAADLAARHRRHGDQLNNHRCWFRNLRPGQEIEHKFTLQTDADIWRLAITTHSQIRAGVLPGWICQHGNHGSFEQWDFPNHLFAITEPATERGYIAFIPPLDGTAGWVIRRKRFPSDRLIRREDLYENVELGPSPDLQRFVRDRFGLQPAWQATYRHVRYNVMLESPATGHLFSIMYDRCTTARRSSTTRTGRSRIHPQPQPPPGRPSSGGRAARTHHLDSLPPRHKRYHLRGGHPVQTHLAGVTPSLVRTTATLGVVVTIPAGAGPTACPGGTIPARGWSP